MYHLIIEGFAEAITGQEVSTHKEVEAPDLILILAKLASIIEALKTVKIFHYYVWVITDSTGKYILDGEFDS